MDYFSRLQRQVTEVLTISLFVAATVVGLGFIWLQSLGLPSWVVIGAVLGVAIIASLAAAFAMSRVVLKPLFVLWRAITHLSDKSQSEAPPQPEEHMLGHQLVSSLLPQLYELASANDAAADQNKKDRKSVLQSVNIVSHMPLPLFVLNKEQLVTNASDAGVQYCEVESSALFGKKLDDNIQLEFPSDSTLEDWIASCIDNKITDTTFWERVRVVIPGPEKRYKRCDMYGYYNRDNPSGTEFIITMFDRTEQYQQDDNNMSFVALAVHELRTPLTLLRGYIEVFVDELDDKLDDEMKDFLRKMDLSAKQLNAFVGNILNVARVDENSLTLHLAEAQWEPTLSEIVAEFRAKAQMHGINIELEVEPDLPTVGIDKISIQEVVGNLLDNAIKYSDTSDRIIIRAAMGKDGFVETTVQDFGLGIPEGVVQHVFEKFYRNHRTKAQVGGSGLGLYLAKALIGAHGGQVWVSSKPGEGSTFGFSLQPFSEVQNTKQQDGLTRTAHGWIKNHSLYRR